ncbi:peptide-methionine (S)-S-oxide reductase MsrA [Chloroflexota bacterium]
MTQHDGNEVATIAGGCFWCLEATFNEVVGIDKVVSGYTGGKTMNPSYSEVCSGPTGHAEAVQLKFDPKRIFFSIHDPTTLNKQGADVGTQYRSAIFYHNENQKVDAEQVIQELNNAKVWSSPIVTEIAPFHEFYVAEDYHQNYFEKNPEQAYCQMVIAPKLAKFRKQYLSRRKIN